MKKTIKLSLILLLTLGITNTTLASYIDSANELASKGVIVDNSSSPDKYRFYDNITRGEMAKITINLSGKSFSLGCSGIFSDLKSSDWACKYAESGNFYGFFASNPTFRPNDNITKIEALKMIMQARGIEKSSNSNWQKAYVEGALAKGILKSSFSDYNTNATRGWIFDIATEDIEEENEINIVSSIDDDITENAIWCGTFQIVWNDMINNLIKGDVVFTPQLKEVINLNKQTFTIKELSSDSYYSDFGKKSIELKNRIERNIKEKFDETSDILDLIDWSNVPEKDDDFGSDGNYIFYTMLKKVFKYEEPFDILNNGNFNNGKYNDIKYFGIKDNFKSNFNKQVDVLYYNSKDDFAVRIKTKEKENIILAMGTNKNSFYETYNFIFEKSEKYEGDKYMGKFDRLKVPNLKIDELKTFDNLTNKEFSIGNFSTGMILDALQTIKLNIDESGGEIKSEALIGMETTSSAIPIEIEQEIRYFYFDRPFTIFLKEEDKNLPYFAAQISDITLFQK